MSVPEALRDAVLAARRDVATLHGELLRWGLVVWTAGNVSARVRGGADADDLVVIKPSGLGYDELTAESKAELQNVLAALKDRPLPDVLVIGHTDTVGDAVGNDRLSAQRAETVKGFLVDIGIPAERIRTAGRGERELLVPTADDVDEPRNRRVEINVR